MDFNVKQQGNIARVYINGDITQYPMEALGEASSASVTRAIRDVEAKEIHVHIDSCGGSMKEAFGIYQALKEHPAKIVTHADGFVASAALYPFVAGDVRIANPLSAFYFHEGWTEAVGYADDLRSTADELEKLTDIGRNAFEQIGMNRDEVAELMKNETWLDCHEALDCGLATEIKGTVPNGFSQSARSRILKQLKAEQKKRNTNQDEQPPKNLFAAFQNKK